MKNQNDDSSDPILAAIDSERTRCLAILELYLPEFAGSSLIHIWLRARNQIAAGDFIERDEDHDGE